MQAGGDKLSSSRRLRNEELIQDTGPVRELAGGLNLGDPGVTHAAFPVSEPNDRIFGVRKEKKI